MHAAVANLSRVALERIGTLAGRVAEDVIASEEELADETLVPAEEVRGTTLRLLRNFLLHVSEGVPPDLEAVREVGRRRAQQGVPLTAVLHGFRIGFRSAWAALVEQIVPDDTETVHALVKDADQMWLLLDVYSAELRDGYRDRNAELLRVTEEERNQHLDVIFAAGAVETGRRLLSAEALGIPREGRFLVLAAQGVDRVTRETWDSVLEDHGARVLWRESPSKSVGMISVSTSVQDWAEVPRHLKVPDTGRVGVSAAFLAVEGAAHALHQALLALGSIPGSDRGVRRYGDDPLGCLIAASIDDAAELTRGALKGLMTLQPTARETLLETLASWFRAGGAVDDAALTLFCHPNTVRYRLRQIEEVTDLHLKDPRHAAQLYLAVRTLAQTGGRDVLFFDSSGFTDPR